MQTLCAQLGNMRLAAPRVRRRERRRGALLASILVGCSPLYFPFVPATPLKRLSITAAMHRKRRQSMRVEQLACGTCLTDALPYPRRPNRRPSHLLRRLRA